MIRFFYVLKETMGCRLSRDATVRSVIPDTHPKASFVKAMSLRRFQQNPQPLVPMVPSVRTRESILVRRFSVVDDKDELNYAVQKTPKE